VRLFLDTEFDGQWGNLISMALVSEDSREWYEVKQDLIVDDWVRENVLPKLNKWPIGHYAFQLSLDKFLAQFESIEIICDWPDDIRYFCETLIIAPGKSFGGNMKFELWDSPTYPESPMRHNALSDAHMLMEMYLGVKH
jgi:hypothetical protein